MKNSTYPWCLYKQKTTIDICKNVFDHQHTLDTRTIPSEKDWGIHFQMKLHENFHLFIKRKLHVLEHTHCISIRSSTSIHKICPWCIQNYSELCWSSLNKMTPTCNSVFVYQTVIGQTKESFLPFLNNFGLLHLSYRQLYVTLCQVLTNSQTLIYTITKTLIWQGVHIALGRVMYPLRTDASVYTWLTPRFPSLPDHPAELLPCN